jgi:nucleolar protein 53
MRKRLLASVDTVKRLGKTVGATLAERARAQAERLAHQREAARAGLAGARLGKHRVPESALDVQLGDELSESLRGLRVRRPLSPCLCLCVSRLCAPRSRREISSATAS